MASVAAEVETSPSSADFHPLEPPVPPLDTDQPAMFDASDVSARRSLPRRHSAEDSTLSPLRDILPPKIVPGFARPLIATPRPSSGCEIAPIALPSTAEDLAKQAANHDTLLQHFTLRKRPSVVGSLSSGFPVRQLYPSSALTRWSFARTVKRFKRRGTAFATGIVDPISPSSWFMTLRQAVVLLAALFEVLFVPFAGLILTDGEFLATFQSRVRSVHMIVEVVLLTDCLLNFNTAVHESQRGHHIVLLRRVDIAKRYARGSFAVDLVGSLPLECVAALTSSDPLIASNPMLFHLKNVVLLLCVRHILKVSKTAWFVDLQHGISARGQAWLGVKFVVLQTMATMTVSLLLTSHYLACVWHAIVSANAPTLTVLGPSHVDPTSGRLSLLDHYFACLLHVVCAIFGHAEPTGVAVVDAFQTFLVVLGVQAFAYLVGALSVLVSNTSYSTHSEFQRKMQSLASKMDKMQLPADLQKRVQQYYAHLWAEYDTLSSDVLDFSRDLTRPLALEVGLYRYMQLVMRVPFWSDCSPDFVSALILTLQVRVFLRDDYVVRRGEIGSEMFMIHRGVGERAGPRCEATRLTNGHFFAEIAVLMDYKRATSVRALTHMELCVLDRAGVHKILLRYHRDRRRVITRIVRTGLEHKDYPEMWQDVVLIGARHSRQEGGKQREGAVRGKANGSHDGLDDLGGEDELSPAEAAELLVGSMNIDDRLDSPLVLTCSADIKAKRGVNGVGRGQKHPQCSSLNSGQTYNSSASSNGRRANRPRKTQSVIIRPQESLNANQTTDDTARTPTATDQPAHAHPGLKLERRGSNQSVDSTASVARSAGSLTSRRAADVEAIALNAVNSREYMRLLTELTDVMTRMEQRIIQMEERAMVPLPLLRTLEDPSPRQDNESLIEVKLSLNSKTSADRASVASSDNHTDRFKVRLPHVQVRGKNRSTSLRTISVKDKKHAVEDQESDGEGTQEPATKTRRSMSVSAPLEAAMLEFQSKIAQNITSPGANARGPRAKRYSTSALADALWSADQL